MEQPSAAQQPMLVDEKSQAQASQALAPAHTGSPVPGGEKVYEMPLWVTVVRGVQLLLGLIIMVLAGLLIHGVLINDWAFALVCGLFTWIVVVYALVSEKVAAARNLYNVYAILALDLLMAIFWLASMGANAKTRSDFKYSVNVFGCYDDGSSIDAHTCIVGRDLEELEKRAKPAVASKAGLAYMSAIAGLSALELILFVATLVFLGLEWKKNRPMNTGATPSNVEMNNVAPGGTVYPPSQQQIPAPAYQAAQPMQPQFTGQQMPPQQQFSPSPVSPGGYAPPMQPQFSGQQQQYTGPQQQQQQMPYQQVPTPGPQGMYSPSVSPAPQGQYPPVQPYNAQPQELPNPQQYQQSNPQQYQQYPPQQ